MSKSNFIYQIHTYEFTWLPAICTLSLYARRIQNHVKTKLFASIGAGEAHEYTRCMSIHKMYGNTQNPFYSKIVRDIGYKRGCVTIIIGSLTLNPGLDRSTQLCICGHTYSKSMDQPGKVANPARGQLNFPCPRSRLRIWSCETGSAVPSRISLLISILRLNLVVTHGIPLDFRGGVSLFKPPYAIGSVPNLSCHAIAFRWRSSPRVGRHRASKPQGSSERVVLLRQVTISQLTCASLSHTHYWYEVGMLKVPAIMR